LGAPLPADADAEVHPPGGDHVEGGDHLGQQNGIIQRDDNDPGHDPKCLGGPGGGGHGRDAQDRGPGRVAVHQVLTGGYPVEAQGLGPAGKLGGVPISVGVEVASESDLRCCHGAS